MATTQSGSVKQDNINEDEAQKALKAEQKFKEAPVKGFADLPPDHPMARRNAAMEQIEAINEQIDGSREGDAAVAAVLANADADTAPGIDAFKESATPVKKEEAPPKKTEAEVQIAAQTKDPIIIDAADLGNYQVRTKVDGVEEVVPATKVLGNYQKGAAADVRLAEATRLRAEAKAALEKAATAAPAKVETTEKSASAGVDEATKKFREASEALYAGDQDRAATLFSEATAALTTPAAGRSDATPASSDALVSQVAEQVTQRLSQKAALDQLFKDYPDIKAKKAFAIIADEYTNAFVANGDDVGTAIAKAGEAIGEEYGLGKWARNVAPVKTSARQPNNGAPTTRAEKLSAKEELDNISSGNARATEVATAEPSVTDVLKDMAAKRPGAALIP
jgi:hypothetical protein